MKPFEIRDVIRQSWVMFLEHWGVLWGALASAIAINVVFDLLTSSAEHGTVGTLLLISLVSIAVTSLVQLGMVRISLHIVRNEYADIAMLVTEYRYLLRYIGASVLYALMVGIGMLLLVIPGIVWAIKYSLYAYTILDKDLSVMDAFAHSAHITDGTKWHLFWFGVVFILLVVVSIVPFGLGLIATLPMGMVAGALLYVTLNGQYEKRQREEQPTSLSSDTGTDSSENPAEIGGMMR